VSGGFLMTSSDVEETCYFCEYNGVKKIDSYNDCFVGELYNPRLELFECPICGSYLIYGHRNKPSGRNFWLKDGEIGEEKKINERKAWGRYDLWRINKDKVGNRCRYKVIIDDSQHNFKDPNQGICLNKATIFERSFPNPIEQLNYLVKFLGEELTYPGTKYDISDISNYNSIETLTLISATVSIDKNNLTGILDNAKEIELIKDNNGKIELSLSGWKKYEELKQGDLNSKFVFMAMQYDENQIKFFKENIEPVVKNFGLELSILPDIHKSENNIDLKLRNAIRESSLLICDLTHRNSGAYFEAGFAEGLGKPIIYICESETFNEHKNNQVDKGDKSKRLHFDIEHMEIYIWKDGDKDSIKKFKEHLDAKIKAIFLYSK
jgi:nucleoside 2-deoxyribosyltransferase